MMSEAESHVIVATPFCFDSNLGSSTKSKTRPAARLAESDSSSKNDEIYYETLYVFDYISVLGAYHGCRSFSRESFTGNWSCSKKRGKPCRDGLSLHTIIWHLVLTRSSIKIWEQALSMPPRILLWQATRRVMVSSHPSPQNSESQATEAGK